MKDFIFDLQRFEDSKFSGGDGSKDNPYLISTKDDLKQLASDVNGGYTGNGTGNTYGGKYFKVTNDINLQGVSYSPIGHYGKWGPITSDWYYFSGNFDGDGHTISNLTNNTAVEQGLFGAVSGATIQNVNLTNVNVTGTDYAGALVGSAGYNSQILNCHAQGSVTSKETGDSSYVGGIVGRINGKVYGCTFDGNVTGKRYDASVGGIVGVNNGGATIQNNVFLGGTITSGSSRKGVIVGRFGCSSPNYYYGDLNGASDNGAIRIYKLTAALPEGVTTADSNVVKINGTKYIKADEVIFNYDGKDYGYTVSEDIISFTTGKNTLIINGKDINPGPNLKQDDYENYLIGSPSNLRALAAYVNGGNDCADLKFKVNANIDMNGERFTAIGASFAGTFYGDGKLILNLGSTSLFAGAPSVSNLLYYYNSPSIDGGTRVYKLTISDGASISGGNSIANNSDTYRYGTVTIDGFDAADDSISIGGAGSGETLAKSGNDFTLGSLTLTGFSDSLKSEWTLESDLANLYNKIYGAYIKGNGINYGLTDAGTPQVKLSGLSFNDSLPTPENGVLNFTADNFSGNVEVTDNAGNYKFNLASGTYNHSFTGTANADSIANAGSNITIFGGTGNDSISNTGAAVSINAGDGANTISNDVGGSNVTIISGDGADSISNAAQNVSISSGAGDDSITNKASAVSIDAGNGDNTISNGGGGSNVTIISGAGADSISNAAQNVSISSGAGNDSISNTASAVSINAGNGDNTISNGGTSAIIIGGTGNDSITNTGDYVTLDGGGGRDTFIWTGGTGVIENFADGNSILQLATGNDSYSTQASGKDLIITAGDIKLTLTGCAENAEDLIDGNIIGSTPVNNEYKIAFNNKAEQELTPEEVAKKAQKATSATLQSDFEGILDANNYRKLKTIQTAKNFTSDINIIGNTKANVISSGAGDDTINGGKKADTLTGGKGADMFIYADGDGRDVIKDYSSEDTLQIDGTIRNASVSGKKVVLKVGTGSITLEKAVGQKITYTDASGTEVTNIYRAEGQYDENETELKFFSTFADTFKASAYKDLETIDGSAVKFEAIEIVGNDRDNSITGGSKTDNLSGGKGSDSIFGGNGADYLDGGDGDDSLNGGTGFDTLIGGAGDDSLTGGAGQNLFVYESGEDVITDFSAGTANKIQLLNDSVTTDYGFSGEDLTLNFGNGSLTIKDYDGGEVRFLDANGNKSSYVFTADALLNANQTSATLAANNFTAYDKLVTIDARKISGAVNIEGNERANKIYANDDGGTYTGGTGNDKFWGGKGSDTFIYADGDGRDVIYGFDNNDALEVNGIDEITATYNAEKNYVRFKCGKGSITLQDFTATEFAVNNDVWTLNGKTLTKN